MKTFLAMGILLFAAPRPARAQAALAGCTPVRSCAKPLTIFANGVLTADGKPLGASNGTYSATCSGDVVWFSSTGDLFKNAQKLGSNIVSYQVNDFTGDVVFVTQGELRKNGGSLGSFVSDYKIASCSGDVAWTNASGDLYENSRLLGHFVTSYDISPDGRVSWQDNTGKAYGP